MNVLDRLKWVRSELELEREEVASDLGLSPVDIKRRETGKPVADFEMYHKLACYYEKCWQNKFPSKNFPKLKGVPVEEITLEWLTLGHNKSSTIKSIVIEELKLMLKEQEEKFAKREIELVTKKLELEMRLGI